MFLLDTDTMSEFLRQRPRRTLVDRFQATPREQLFTSTITLGEMLYGAFRRPARTQDLSEQIERLLVTEVSILPFDEAAARAYGRIRAELESAGTPIGDADTRIAAIALANGLVVVTGNVRHFERVPGLTVENWLAADGDDDDPA